MLDIPTLVQQCAPTVSPVLMQALIRKESSFNPFAIGVDGGNDRVVQPKNFEEAVATVKDLTSRGITFSVGLAQIHVGNINKSNMTWEQAFDPCQNLAKGEAILWAFWRKAVAEGYKDVGAVWAALRGYNSGDVHKRVSNDYANTIFRFMKEPVPYQITLKNMATSTAPSDQAPAVGQVVATLAPEAGTQDVFESAQGNGKEGF